MAMVIRVSDCRVRSPRRTVKLLHEVRIRPLWSVMADSVDQVRTLLVQTKICFILSSHGFRI